MKLQLTGTWEQNIYKWHPEVEGHLPCGQVTVNIRFRVIAENGVCKFSFNDYEGFNEGDDPKNHETVHKGLFPCSDEWPIYSTHTDMSGGLWHKFVWTGEYVGWASKWYEVQIDMHEGGQTSGWATWLHNQYPRGPKDMKTEHTMFDADLKTRKMLGGLITEIERRKTA